MSQTGVCVLSLALICLNHNSVMLMYKYSVTVVGTGIISVVSPPIGHLLCAHCGQGLPR